MTARIHSPGHRPPSRLWPLLFALLLSACGGGADNGPTVPATASAIAAPPATILAADGAAGLSAPEVSATRKAVAMAASLRAKRGNVSAAAVATTVGPLRFTRQTGAPVTVTQTFSQCGGGCQLVVLNGEPDGSNRVSAATVYLNGQKVLAPADFNQKVDRLVVPIEATDATEISVVLRSKPGSYLTVTVECAAFVALVIEDAPGIGVSTWDDGTVALAFPLVNEGPLAARGVKLTAMSAAPGSYQGPKPFAYTVGDIGPETMQSVDGYFSGLGTTASFPLRVSGTYQVGSATCPFEARANVVKPAAAGPVVATPGLAVVQSPRTAFFPPASTASPSFGPNAESPMLIPIGPQRQLFPPTPVSTHLGTSAGGALVQISRSTSMRGAGVPPDPNAAATAGGVVLATYNTGISYSTNGGATFTDVNLFNPQPGNPARTSFFPSSDGGLCCDQIVVYLPRQNLFVWLLQYQPVVNTAVTPNVITTPDRLRVAWATPAAVAADFWNAWTYADLTGTNVPAVSSGLGIASNEWLDYPDLSFSDTFLYVGIDQGFPTPGQVYTGRRIVARLSLADMANPAATVVNYAFARLTGSNGLNKTHFVQNAPAQMVVGSLDNSSTMRLFTWRDAENTITPSTVAISQIQQGASYTSLAPDGSDWVAVSFPGNITGAAYRSFTPGLGSSPRDEFLFAFDAGANAGGSRPRSYVRVETVTPVSGGFQAVAEYDVWNPDYAFAMAGLAADGIDIALTLGVGGGTIGYPQFSVGFMNDLVVYQVTAGNAAQGSRFGDYIAPRLIAGAGRFSVEVYDVLLNPLPPGTSSGVCSTVGCTANMRYVEFGRPPPPPGPR